MEKTGERIIIVRSNLIIYSITDLMLKQLNYVKLD